MLMVFAETQGVKYARSRNYLRINNSHLTEETLDKKKKEHIVVLGYHRYA